MTKFIQLHILTAYPPANLNRDELGRPKTTVMGGTERLRVSSQCLKRTWRTSDLFKQLFEEKHLGVRTKRIGQEVYEKLIAANINEDNAKAWAEKIAANFGKVKKEDVKQKEVKESKEKNKKIIIETEQLAHISPEENKAINHLIDQIVAEQLEPNDETIALLSKELSAVDIALFGRMLASSPAYNIEAACQVAHAISVHSVTTENDYFTAVDDLNRGDEDRGAAHIGDSGFGAALFYSYICIDRELLIKNLDNNKELADQAIAGLTEAALKVSPKGKQSSFGSRAYASYALVEVGNQQPRSLSVAFLRPVYGDDYAEDARHKLTEQRNKFEKVYGPCAERHYELDAIEGKGSLSELLTFLR